MPAATATQPTSRMLTRAAPGEGEAAAPSAAPVALHPADTHSEASSLMHAGDSSGGPNAGPWRDSHRNGTGWWAWRPWIRRWRGTARTSVGPPAVPSALTLPPSPQRAGYAQAAEAQAAAMRNEGWLGWFVDQMARHLFGAFGSHGIRELDLDRKDLL